MDSSAINLAARASDYGQNVGTDVHGIPGINGSTAFQSGTPGFIRNNSLSQPMRILPMG